MRNEFVLSDARLIIVGSRENGRRVHRKEQEEFRQYLRYSFQRKKSRK